MLGRFLEIGLPTTNIGASVQFYERLGFRQLIANDTWSHPYGVLTDGRVFLGLHRGHVAAPSLTFVRPELARHLAELRADGLVPEAERLGEDDFHELELREPGGHLVTLLEARTFSPAPPRIVASACGYFLHYGLPQADIDSARAFWERAGWVAVTETERPYAHLPLTSDLLDLAFHARRSLAAPLLVFELEDLGAAKTRLSDLGITPQAKLPLGLGHDGAALIEAPEGTLLLLVAASS
jgi:catechol 2,3-dioxygenase-like lactoylglutathione lyase family enzyme